MQESHTHGDVDLARVAKAAGFRPPGMIYDIAELGSAVELTESDLAMVDELLSNRTKAGAGTTLISDGQVNYDAFVLLSGWAFRARVFEDGRRQISRLFLPGDSIAVSSSLLGIPEQAITALTDVRLARIDPKLLMGKLRDSSRLWSALLWSDVRDRLITEEQVACIGRRSAYQRLAHVFLELYARLELIGEETGNAYTLPLTQEHLADLLGLTSIHVNRVLHRLKVDGLIALEGRTIRLLSRDDLIRIADFDPKYLVHQQFLPTEHVK